MDHSLIKPPKLVDRRMVVAYARDWLKTPYMHQASKKGIGCDCLGLLRGVWQDIYEVEAERPPSYTPVWAELSKNGQEPMLEAAMRHLIPVKPGNQKHGDVVLIRIRKQSAIKHCGIVSYDNHLIHAYDRHCVIEEPMRKSWIPRKLHFFSFPGVID